MKRAGLLSLFVVSLALSSAIAQTAGARAKDPTLQAAIDGRQKALDSRNAAEWSKYTGDDFAYVGVDGAIATRAERLKALATRSTVPTEPVIDSVRTFGPDTAITIQRNPSAKTRITQVWVRQGGSWKVVSVHMSPITGK
jgi:hypothetical protein